MKRLARFGNELKSSSRAFSSARIFGRPVALAVRGRPGRPLVGVARHRHPHLDRGVAVDVARLQRRAPVAADGLALDVARVAPDPVERVVGVERRVGEARGQVVEVEVPLRAPDGPADVEHVVVGDDRVADAVGERRASAARRSPGSARRSGDAGVRRRDAEDAGPVVAAERRVAAGLGSACRPG